MANKSLSDLNKKVLFFTQATRPLEIFKGFFHIIETLGSRLMEALSPHVSMITDIGRKCESHIGFSKFVSEDTC